MALLMVIPYKAKNYSAGVGTRISNEYRDRTGTLGLTIESVVPRMQSIFNVSRSLTIGIRKMPAPNGAGAFCNLQVVDKTIAQPRSISWIMQRASLACLRGVSTPELNYFSDLGVTE